MAIPSEAAGVAALLLFALSVGTGAARSAGALREPVILSSPGNPLVAFRFVFHVGSAHDPAGKEGLNALTALTLGKGGTVGLSLRQVMEKLYPMAGQIEVQPDKEVTTFIGQVHRDHLQDFYVIFRDLLLQPRFDPEDFERNRNELLLYLSKTLRGNNDEELGKQALQEMIYRGHPYRHPVQGTVAGLKAIALEDVNSFYRARYNRGSLEIGLAGDLPSGFVQKLLGEFGEALPEASPPAIALPDPGAGQGIEVLIVEKPAEATAVSIGFPIAVTRSDPDFYPLLVANTYLGDHRTFNGVLMRELRSKRGLNYGDYSYLENFIQDGGSTFPVPNIPRRQQYTSIWLRPLPAANAHFAIRGALRELRNLVERGMSREDFEATRHYLLNYSKLWVQSLDRRLGYLLDSRFYRTDFYIDEIERRLKPLTPEEVNRAVRKHLDSKNIKVAIVAANASDLASAIRENRPSPVSYQTPGTDPAVLEEDKQIERYRLEIREVKVVPVTEIFER